MSASLPLVSLFYSNDVWEKWNQEPARSWTANIDFTTVPPRTFKIPSSDILIRQQNHVPDHGIPSCRSSSWYIRIVDMTRRLSTLFGQGGGMGYQHMVSAYVKCRAAFRMAWWETLRLVVCSANSRDGTWATFAHNTLVSLRTQGIDFRWPYIEGRMWYGWLRCLRHSHVNLV